MVSLLMRTYIIRLMPSMNISRMVISLWSWVAVRVPQIPDASVDVVYGLETLVHCSDKEKVLREIYRIMKPGGVMVNYDYALSDRFETFDWHVQTAIALISKGGASAMIESLDEWNTHFTNSGFTIEKIPTILTNFFLT